MKVFLFPGQGSQVRGMGGALFDEFPEATRQASEVLGYSIRELCLEDPRRQLSQTRFTQPAIYVVNALSYFHRIQEGAAPELFAGHSLGEFNALMAGGCFDFELGLRLVKKRGELMGQVSSGAMAAVVNLTREAIAAILKEQGATGVDIAIHNSPLQSVIAGTKEDLARVEPALRAGNAQYHPLNTSGAFHSRYMRSVSEEFRSFLQGIELHPLAKPVIANVSARPYRDGEVVSNLVEQLTRPVLWCESVQYLLSLPGAEMQEVGHGDVLTKMLTWIKAQSPAPAVQATPVATAASPASAVAPGAGERQRAAQERVAAWNAAHPIGTTVRSSLVQGKDLETRTEAVVLFGHRAAVYLKDYNGYFDLEQIQTVSATA